MNKPQLVYEIERHSIKAGKYRVQVWTPTVAQVELISFTDSPANTMAIVTRGYTGVYSPDLPDKDERDRLLADITKTKLATPTEMIHFTWLIQGVTRAWTHQAVRYRVGTAYVQESMRFLGHKGVYKVLLTDKLAKHPESEEAQHYSRTVCDSVVAYVDLIDNGVPDQDARGVLPTNILTSLFWDMSLSTLMHVYNTRVCCQAQTGEWVPILLQMKDWLRQVSPATSEMLTAPIDRGEPCGFNASFDRPCTWKVRDGNK